MPWTNASTTITMPMIWCAKLKSAHSTPRALRGIATQSQMRHATEVKSCTIQWILKERNALNETAPSGNAMTKATPSRIACRTTRSLMYPGCAVVLMLEVPVTEGTLAAVPRALFMLVKKTPGTEELVATRLTFRGKERHHSENVA